MGWFIRKSKSVGPVRFNLSKSGVGVSTGVKGARMSFGPRGTYVNLGRNGIYYRKKIGGGKSSRKSSNYGAKNAGVVQPQYNYSQEIPTYEDAIKVSENSYSESVLGQEIIKDIKRARLFFWLWLIASIALIYFLKEWGLIIAIVALIPMSFLFSARLNFELDDEADLEWKKIIEIIYSMRTAKKLWLVESASYNANTKVNAGAYRNISRGDATVKLLKAKRGTGLKVKANCPTVLIKSKKCKILFIPSGILIKKGSKYFAYSYEQINLFSSTTNFIENGPVARDAEVIRRTWQYVNRDGSPDRRYKNNKQLPVCLYGSLDIRGNNLDIELQTSNKTVTRNVDSAYRHYKEYVRKIGNSDYNPAGTTPSPVTKTVNTPFISYEERKILEEMNGTLRELGRNGYVEVMEEDLGCNVQFIDGQLYQGHALFLYKASQPVSSKLKSLEYKFNASTPYRNDIEAVNEREFLVHLYMDNLEDFKKELPLSAVLEKAIDSSSRYSEPYEPEESYEGIPGNDTDEMDELLASGASLFSGDIDTSTSEEEDPYADLFSLDDNDTSDDINAKNNPDSMDDLMGFFDEE